ncbi:MAG: GntR family transcriptional regulator [Xanthobacteraceae bacterium]
MLSKIPVQAAPLRSRVAERLRQAITSGQLKAGEHLRERELCEQLGVSRTSIRESLRILESEGLINSIPNKGVVVSAMTLKESQDVYDTRAALEGLLVRQFVRNATDQQIAKLIEIVDTIKKHNANFKVDRFVKLKQRFYDLIIEGADNQIAANALRAIHARVARLWVTSLTNPERADRSEVEIRALVSAIQDRDEEAAVKACADHIASAARNVMQVMVERGHSTSTASSGRLTPSRSRKEAALVE